MSTRLDLALHELADAVSDTTTFGDPTSVGTGVTVHRIAASVRRRRAARHAGTAAVAASAVGAVALAGPRLTTDGVPVADAPPGTCRSALGLLPVAPGALDVTLGYIAADGSSTTTSGDGATLGTWQGDTAQVHAQRLVDVAGDAPAQIAPEAVDLLVAQDGVVVATSPADVPDLRIDPLEADDPASAFGFVEDAGTDGAWYGLLGDGRLEVGWSALLDLTSCLTGDRLPAGTYDVWAAQESDGVVRRTAGPWSVTATAAQPAVTGLPDGFPAEVPLVGGRLVAAHPHGSGWAAEIETPGDDRAALANALLTDAAAAGGSTSHGFAVEESETLARALTYTYTFDQDGVRLPGWTVRVVPSHTVDGAPSVVYVLRPTL